MTIHIGAIIRRLVEEKRLTYKEFGALIDRNEKTIPDIYERESISTALLLDISKALNVDLLRYFYEEAPLKNIRDEENREFLEKIKWLTERVAQVEKELVWKQELIDALRGHLSAANELMEEYRKKMICETNKIGT